MISKKLHFIWVGDQSKRPDNCINTWIRRHPGWEIRIWGNEDLASYGWINAPHMREMAKRELNGVADMMRWEILYNEGGIVLDADSVCIRPLPEWMLETEAFACWESEINRPGLIAAGYVGSVPENPFFGQIIQNIQAKPTVTDALAWKTVGPLELTQAYQKYAYNNLTIFPSHFFIPEHFSGLRYEGPGPVFAHQEWGSTRRIYDELHMKPVERVQHPTSTSDSMTSAVLQGLEGSALAKRHEPYFVQTVPVRSDLEGLSRSDVFRRLCEGRRVLHVGCVDWPITNPRQSLHVQLAGYCKQLDGFDIHAESFDLLRPELPPGSRLFSEWSEVTENYDLVIAPEVLEHVPDVQDFLKQLNQINAREFLLTVPDAYSCFSAHFERLPEQNLMVEVVHPDHNCWYTPYTFSNVLRKYTPWRLDGMWFFNRISLLALLTKPQAQE